MRTDFVLRFFSELVWYMTILAVMFGIWLESSDTFKCPVYKRIALENKLEKCFIWIVLGWN